MLCRLAVNIFPQGTAADLDQSLFSVDSDGVNLAEIDNEVLRRRRARGRVSSTFDGDLEAVLGSIEDLRALSEHCVVQMSEEYIQYRFGDILSGSRQNDELCSLDRIVCPPLDDLLV